jgi:hypothetical protein
VRALLDTEEFTQDLGTIGSFFPTRPMPSNREIARDWDVSSSYVDRCVKRGCPTESFEAARLWRAANAQRVRNPEKIRGSGAEEITTQNVSHRRQIPEEIGEDFVLGTKEAVRQSWRYLREALIEGKVQKIGAWMALHTRAVEANVKAEAMVREELERKKVLIPMSVAQTFTRKVVGVIVSHLTALPQNAAPRCNPTNPNLAMTVLEDECAAILRDARQAL